MESRTRTRPESPSTGWVNRKLTPPLSPATPRSRVPPTDPASKPFPWETCLTRLNTYIDKERPGLRDVYDAARLKDCAKKAEIMIQALQSKGCTLEYAKDFSILVLFDIVMLLDDSSSMEDEEDGERIKTLQNTINAITEVYDHANSDGILSVKFLNDDKGKKKITRRNVKNVLAKHYFHGPTQIGTMLDKRVLKRFVYGPREINKPLLVMVITDGEVEGETDCQLRRVINTCVDTCTRERHGKLGKDAVAFHFSRVGNDEGAQALLEGLDRDGGDNVDCLPVDKKLENITGVEKWNVLRKLLLGALVKGINDDDVYHKPKDEAGDLPEKQQETQDAEDSDDEVEEEMGGADGGGGDGGGGDGGGGEEGEDEEGEDEEGEHEDEEDEYKSDYEIEEAHPEERPEGPPVGIPQGLPRRIRTRSRPDAAQ